MSDSQGVIPVMSRIISLKSRMSQTEAVKRFRGGAIGGWFRTWKRGQLVDARAVYIPYRMFQVTVTNRGQAQVSWLALDAVTGRLDPYQFESSLDQADLCTVETDAALPIRLSVEEVRTSLIERVRRRVYLNGFFRLRDLRIEAEHVGTEAHIPYWVGIYRKGDRMSIDVIDAVRKQLEGAKVRDVILHWL